MNTMTNYCPGDAIGSPGLVDAGDVDSYEANDRAFIDEMRVLWPDRYQTYPHRTGTCRKCAPKDERPQTVPHDCFCDRKYVEFVAHPDGYNVRSHCAHCGWQNRSVDATLARKFTEERTAGCSHRLSMVGANIVECSRCMRVWVIECTQKNEHSAR